MMKRNHVTAVMIILAVCMTIQFVVAEDGDAGKRFQVSGEGSVSDAESGLHWTTRDNQADIGWHKATTYCHELVLDKSSSWRLPTIEELEGIFDERGYRGPLSVKISRASSWSSTRDGSSAALYFDFNYGRQGSSALEMSSDLRALCVRDSDEKAE